VLDKGVVIDVFARVSLVGIELVRADARVVIASVDTYLRFAQVCASPKRPTVSRWARRSRGT
jgi:hypothetical protein